MSKFKHILIVSGESVSIPPTVLLGISRYARSHGCHWHLLTAPLIVDTLEPLRKWKADGVFGIAGTFAMKQTAKTLPFPFINLYTRRLFAGTLQVGADWRALGTVAAAHFADHGIYRLLFVSDFPRGQQDLAMEGFVEEATRRNLSVETIRITNTPLREPRLHQIIQAYQEPIGLCAIDPLACGLLRVCREVERPVPDRISVLGLGNNTSLCERAFPPLSSVSWEEDNAGYLAAQLLHCILEQRDIPEQQVLTPPIDVVHRDSTDSLYAQDALIKKALIIMNERITEKLSINDIAREIGVSRRGLETRFRTVLKRSPYEEIQILRIKRAQRLLRETDWTLERIAEEAGFGSGIHLGIQFKKRLKQSPGAYRKQCRP